MSGSPRVIVRSKRRVFDGFFKLDEVLVSYRQFDGTMSTEKPLLIFERGDAVAALILNRDSGEVVLVEQFRAPTLEKGRIDGWMIEAPAGMIRGNESPEQAVTREVLEETGYRIESPEHIATFFSSPAARPNGFFCSTRWSRMPTRSDRAPAIARTGRTSGSSRCRSRTYSSGCDRPPSRIRN